MMFSMRIPMLWSLVYMSTYMTYMSMPNHSSAQAEAQFDWLRDSYRVVSDRSYCQGEQVVINYGSQSNDQLLQLYGFVEPDNANDRRD